MLYYGCSKTEFVGIDMNLKHVHIETGDTAVTRKKVILSAAAVIFALIYITTGCTSNSETEKMENSVSQAYIYTEIATTNDYDQSVFGGIMAATPFSVRQNGDYIFAYTYMDVERDYEWGLAIAGYGDEAGFYEIKKLSSEDVSHFTSGERGIYTYGRYSGEEDSFSGDCLSMYSWDGELIAEACESELAPDTSDSWSGYPQSIDLPLIETEDGAILLYGSCAVVLEVNESEHRFEHISDIALPGEGYAAMRDSDGQNWVCWYDGNTSVISKLTEDGVGGGYILPDRFNTHGKVEINGSVIVDYINVIGMRGDALYAWDKNGVFSWQIPEHYDYSGAEVIDSAEKKNEASEPSDVMILQDACIVPNRVSRIHMIPCADEARFTVLEKIRDNDTAEKLTVYKPDPTIDLSKIETISIYTYKNDTFLQSAVSEFNRSNRDVRANICDYSVYDTPENMMAGYKRLMLEVSTGVVKPDILFMYRDDYVNMTRSDPEYFTDIYTLMNRTVRREDIFEGVLRSLESEDGKLYGIFPSFYIKTLYGKRDVLSDYAGDGVTGHWNITEFLNFADSLRDGEYLIEDLSKTNFRNWLFGGCCMMEFARANHADFNNDNFIRLLEFIKGLPDEPQKYMDHGSGNVMDIIAGAVSPDEAEITSGGENLYYSGKIKLKSIQRVQSETKLLGMMNDFGVDSIRDMLMVGYPVDDDTKSGVIIVPNDGIYTIPSCCANYEAAWRFLESCLMYNSPDKIIPGRLDRTAFDSYRPYYEKYAEAMIGVKSFYAYSGFYFTTSDEIELDENGEYDGMPGKIYAIDRDMIDYIIGVFEEGGVPYYKFDAAYSEINGIVNEEISAYLAGSKTPEICARTIQSRADIWISERKTD